MVLILFVLEHFQLSVASLSSIIVQPELLNMTTASPQNHNFLFIATSLH